MDAKMRPLAWSLLFLGGAIALANHAAGQDLSARMPAGVPGFSTWAGAPAGPDPAWQPLGVRLGTMLLHPSVSAGLGYDSNVLGASPARGSWVLGTHAALAAESGETPRRVGGYLGIDDTRLPDLPRQGRTDWTAALGGTIGVGADQLTLGATHLSAHQDRTELDALPSDQPVPYQVDDFRTAYAVPLGRLTLTPSFEAALYRFGDTTIRGLPASQGYRDRTVLRGALTAAWEAAPGRDVLLVVRGLSSHYTAPQPGAPTRNSTGWEVLGGIDQTFDAVWRMRLLLGWQQREFASPAFRTHGAAVAEADVIWSPSPLLDITATLGRSIEDAAQEGIAGYVASTARLGIGYQWRRNVRLDSSAGLRHASFLGAGGTQTGVVLEAQATWWLNRRLRLSWQESLTALRGGGTAPDTATSNYTRAISLLTAGFAL